MAATPPGVVVGMAFTGVLRAALRAAIQLWCHVFGGVARRAPQHRPATFVQAFGLKTGVRGDVGMRIVA
jgi:hypothetical protein